MQIKKQFHSDHYIASYIADEIHTDMRLDNFALLFYPQLSREKIKKKIKDKELLITSRNASNKASSKIKEGDTIQITIHKTIHEDEYWNGEKLTLEEHPEIIHEDENLIAISKPAFMATHPTGKHLFFCATVYFESRDQKTIHSIHRLDRETSGILLLARNPKTAQELTKYFENGQVKKCYFFIAHNHASNNTTSFYSDLRLGSEGEDLRARVVTEAFPANSTHGKHAHTEFKILASNTDYVIGLAFPKTGRQHQIRVHAAESGYPLLGDKLYHGGYEMFQHFKDGVATSDEYSYMQIPRHALHAIAIKTILNKTPIQFTTNIPQDLKKWIDNTKNFNLCDIESKLIMEINNWMDNNEQ